MRSRRERCSYGGARSRHERHFTHKAAISAAINVEIMAKFRHGQPVCRLNRHPQSAELSQILRQLDQGLADCLTKNGAFAASFEILRVK